MAKLCKQVRIEVPDAVGKLADVGEKLAAAGVNMLSVAAWVEDGKGVLLVVPDDCDKACAALEKVAGACRCDEVVCAEMPNQPGALAKAARKLADAGIAIQHAHGTACAGKTACVVLATSDNAKAAELI